MCRVRTSTLNRHQLSVNLGGKSNVPAARTKFKERSFSSCCRESVKLLRTMKKRTIKIIKKRFTRRIRVFLEHFCVDKMNARAVCENFMSCFRSSSTVILQLFCVILFSVFSVVNGFTVHSEIFPKLCLVLKNRFLVRLSSNFQERLFMPSASPEFLLWWDYF